MITSNNKFKLSRRMGNTNASRLNIYSNHNNNNRPSRHRLCNNTSVSRRKMYSNIRGSRHRLHNNDLKKKTQRSSH